jgi:hypothetical protein
MTTEQLFTIRFAAGDEDVKRLFHFLVIISLPSQLAKVDPVDAITEVKRIVDGASTGDSFAVLAEINGEIVGSLGIMKTAWWYNTKAFFLADRWVFCYPVLWNKGVGARLLAEAGVISKSAEMPIIIHGHAKKRNNGIYFVKPLTILPDEVDKIDWDLAAKKVIVS